MTDETKSPATLEGRLGALLGTPHWSLRSQATVHVPVGRAREHTAITWVHGALTFCNHGSDAVVRIAAARAAAIDVIDLDEDLPHVWEICDAESGDLEAVATRLVDAAKNGPLYDMYCNRLIILDSVEVVDGFRGMGAGKVAAAATLVGGGALDMNTFTAAIAGAGAHTSGGTEDPVTVRAAARVLTGVGLTREPTQYGDVYIGDPNLASYDRPLRRILKRS